MTRSTRTRGSAQEVAATNLRSFRTFLLVQQFEAREIGARIARARELAGFTQEQLAEMASFSKRSLQDYEGGVTIPYKHLRELGKLLKRDPEWFLYGDEEAVTDGELAELRREVAALHEKLDRQAERVETLLERLAPAPASERGS